MLTARDRLTEGLGRVPTATEIGDEVGLEVDEVLEALSAAEVRHTLSLNSPRGADDEAPARRVTSIIEVGGLGEGGGVSSTEVWGFGEGDELRQLAPLSARHLRRLRLAGYRADQFAAHGAIR